MNKTCAKVSEKTVVRKSLASQAEAKKAGSANIDEMKPPEHTFQQAEPAEY